MIQDVVIAALFLVIGLLAGYLYSHRVYGRMVDAGKLLFKTEDGWDGVDGAMWGAKVYLANWNGRDEV